MLKLVEVQDHLIFLIGHIIEYLVVQVTIQLIDVLSIIISIDMELQEQE